MYGTTLRLPGEFIHPSPPDPSADPADFVGRLKTTMSQLQPTLVRKQPQRATHLPPALSTCTHVFVRWDVVKKPLQPPYDGPYRVLQRQSKYYTLEMRGKKDTVLVAQAGSPGVHPHSRTSCDLSLPYPLSQLLQPTSQQHRFPKHWLHHVAQIPQQALRHPPQHPTAAPETPDPDNESTGLSTWMITIHVDTGGGVL